LKTKLFHFAFVAHFALVVFASACALVPDAPAQTTATTPATNAAPAVRQPAPDADAARRTNADETFDLNIPERRISESNYEASTSVEILEEGTSGVNLRVGVMLGASNIDVLLRNVRGRVRFRGSLESVLQRLNERRAPPPSSRVPAPPANDLSP
jgi:hypothetical protein